MKELVIASNNPGKIKEIRVLVSGIDLRSLKDIGFEKEIPEPYNTFNENAATKAKTVYEFCGKNVFADDSGLCVPALDNAPGVISAHYAGFPRSDERNLQKLLDELKGKTDRAAYYKAVICLIWDRATTFFEGTCYGRISEEKRGEGGFGYDPVFVPEGYDKTFAELSIEVKNKLSHRGEAVRKMVAFIKNNM